MNRFGVVVTGDKAIVENFEKFDARVRAKAEFIVLNNGLKFLNRARMLAPVRDGRLRNSISYKLAADRLSVEVGPNVFYAVYVEYGTGVFATGPGGSRAIKIPWVYRDGKTGKFYTTAGNVAKPFMRPAWEQSQPLFIRDLETMFQKELAA